MSPPNEEDVVDVDAAPTITDSDLSAVATLAAQQIIAERLVSEKTAELKAAQEALRAIAEDALPGAMTHCGLKDFTTTDGYQIAVSTSYHAGIKEEHREAAFAWLKAHGHDDIIKTDVTVSFGRGEEEAAKVFMSDLEDRFPENKKAFKPGVHAQTLGAFVREQIADNAPLPMDVFGVYTKTVSKVTPPDAKKAALDAAAKRK